jgi:hypothetical protein
MTAYLKSAGIFVYLSYESKRNINREDKRGSE